jgi:hypothetical protein
MTSATGPKLTWIAIFPGQVTVEVSLRPLGPASKRIWLSHNPPWPAALSVPRAANAL